MTDKMKEAFDKQFPVLAAQLKMAEVGAISHLEAINARHKLAAFKAGWESCSKANEQESEVQPESSCISDLQKEAVRLSEMLVGMCEGSSPSPEELWDDNYQPADGDVYVHRAAIVLGLLGEARPNLIP